MRSRYALFVTTAFIEIGTGAALLIVPGDVIRLLIGVQDPPATALIAGRVAGVALLVLGSAAWLRRAAHGDSQRGLLRVMLAYNVGIGVALVVAGALLGLLGILLWPAVLLHTAMAVWCLRCFQLRAAYAQDQ